MSRLRLVRSTSLLVAAALTRRSSCDERFKTISPGCEDQQFRPACPYPQWDSNWDLRKRLLKAADVKALMGHQELDDREACRLILTEHSDRSPAQIEQILTEHSDDLSELYVRLYNRKIGGVTRHILLVRHGQYDETYNSPPFSDGETLRHDPHDVKRVLTPLGQEQALAVGRRLAELTSAALSTPGREGHVRLLSSNSTRAIQTADLIATQLPPHVHTPANDKNLNEGYPAHRIPHSRGEAPQDESEAIMVEGARIEAAFKEHFYREEPLAAEEAKLDTRKDRYDIIVCHGNVIRYFALRLLQLPPEAWLRSAAFNCSLTHLVIRPSGNVSLFAFGDTGHLPLDKTTYSMHHGYEW